MPILVIKAKELDELTTNFIIMGPWPGSGDNIARYLQCERRYDGEGCWHYVIFSDGIHVKALTDEEYGRSRKATWRQVAEGVEAAKKSFFGLHSYFIGDGIEDVQIVYRR